MPIIVIFTHARQKWKLMKTAVEVILENSIDKKKIQFEISSMNV
tara:strand:+ start:153 stop:284 length:132 start_codon:yes stop_codon:yes gene_type:complete